MRRLYCAMLMVAVLPFTVTAQTPKSNVKKASDVQPIPTVMPLGEAKPASFAHAPRPLAVAPDGPTATTLPVLPPTGPVGPISFGDRLRAAYYEHICAPDGCPKPIGCGNFWTEKKFIFGSCRQFFGTAEASVGHHRKTTLP